ncbi:MAG TPA: reverse transcriptase domain-containing protein, partial [Casimicrobium sp.]|nr:reverse transcriptase domain-containing protein [Casimicrobium sp.]
MPSWLHRLIKRSVLDAAFDRVAENQGGPGIDGQTLADFGALIDVEISALQHEVLSSTYQPKALLSVNLPRAGKRPRELGIPSVRDRVLQTACAQLPTPTLEAAFEDCSFAYRSGRGVRQAVARIELLRNEGYSYVVDADIETFFDSIPHQGLLATLRRHVNDSRFVDLVGQWLR